MAKGWKMSYESRCKISVGKKGKPSWNKGIPMSDESKIKLSVSKTGVPVREEVKQRISKTYKERKINVGRKLSEETKRRISESKTGVKLSAESLQKRNSKIDFTGENNPFYGKKHSDETRNKISRALENLYADPEKHPRWLGGVASEPYCVVWRDQDYKYSIKVRDNFECQNPFCVGGSDILVVHHINYNKKDCHPSNLITLCNACNSRANSNRDAWALLYRNIILSKSGKQSIFTLYNLELITKGGFKLWQDMALQLQEASGSDPSRKPLEFGEHPMWTIPS